MKHATVYLIGAGVVGVGALALVTSHRTPPPAQSLGVLMPGVGADTSGGISVPRSDPSNPGSSIWTTIRDMPTFGITDPIRLPGTTAGFNTSADAPPYFIDDPIGRTGEYQLDPTTPY